MLLYWVFFVGSSTPAAAAAAPFLSRGRSLMSSLKQVQAH